MLKYIMRRFPVSEAKERALIKRMEELYAHPTGFSTEKLTTCHYWCNIPIDGGMRAIAINYF